MIQQEVVKKSVKCDDKFSIVPLLTHNKHEDTHNNNNKHEDTHNNNNNKHEDTQHQA